MKAPRVRMIALNHGATGVPPLYPGSARRGM